MCTNVSFACARCNGPCTHAHVRVGPCPCMRVCVCRADQMLCCSLQGALISSVFTVAGGQQRCSQACCWPNRDEWHRLERTTPPRRPANTPSTPLHMHSENHTHTQPPFYQWLRVFYYQTSHRITLNHVKLQLHKLQNIAQCFIYKMNILPPHLPLYLYPIVLLLVK